MSFSVVLTSNAAQVSEEIMKFSLSQLNIVSEEIKNSANNVRNISRRLVKNSPRGGNTYDLIRSKKTGRIYLSNPDLLKGKRRKSTKIVRRHKASAPGEAPAILFSRLVNNIDTGDERYLSIRVGVVNVKYAKYHEEPENKSRRRPFLQPALDEEIPRLVTRINNRIRGIVQ